MNDNIAPFFVGFLLVLAGAIGISWKLGVSEENNRLYQKCITKNAEAPYNKAVTLCKEETR